MGMELSTMIFKKNRNSCSMNKNEGYYHRGHGRWTFKHKPVRVPRAFSRNLDFDSENQQNGNETCRFSDKYESVVNIY